MHSRRTVTESYPREELPEPFGDLLEYVKKAKPLREHESVRSISEIDLENDKCYYALVAQDADLDGDFELFIGISETDFLEPIYRVFGNGGEIAVMDDRFWYNGFFRDWNHITPVKLEESQVEDMVDEAQSIRYHESLFL